jgi:hypothetical protein
MTVRYLDDGGEDTVARDYCMGLTLPLTKVNASSFTQQ